MWDSSKGNVFCGFCWCSYEKSHFKFCQNIMVGGGLESPSLLFVYHCCLPLIADSQQCSMNLLIEYIERQTNY